MNQPTRPKLLAILCILAAGLMGSRANAEDKAPAGQSTAPSPAPAAVVETTQSVGCNTTRKPANAGGASIAQAAGESLQHKSWQARGGEIQFTIVSFVGIPPDASVLACFRWQSVPENDGVFIETHPTRLDLSGDGKLLKVTTTVPPDLGPQPPRIAMALPLVPLAEVRILAVNKKNEPTMDVITSIGITHPVIAALFAVVTVTLGLLVLHVACGRRLNHPGILRANWLLRIISTPNGFASLSQFQILLWTFVVAASAVYVMSLSGELIQITNGTLILLGIAGAAAIGAKIHDEARAATAEGSAAKAAEDKAIAINAAENHAAAATTAAADPVAAARTTAERNAADAEAVARAAAADTMKARADALKNPPATQIPRWSDLIVNESARDDGSTTREIDITRFQMLLFTFVTAVFVLMSVVTTYVIPEISAGFVTLMGISNGVYIGSKVVQRS
jgi:hypothetical protein